MAVGLAVRVVAMAAMVVAKVARWGKEAPTGVVMAMVVAVTAR